MVCPRAALCALLAATAALLSLAATAHAGIVALEPADGTIVAVTSSLGGPRLATVTLRVRTSTPSLLGPDALISTSRVTGPDGALTPDPGHLAEYFIADSYGAATYSHAAFFTAPGDYYWQARNVDCSQDPCRTELTEVRRITVIDPPTVIAPPRQTAPADGVSVTAGQRVRLTAADPDASGLTFHVRDHNDQTVATLAGRAETGSFAASWSPESAGRFTWHAQRTGCRPPTALFPPPIDCTSQTLSARRTVTAKLPAANLRLRGGRSVYRGGGIPVRVTCATRPCKLTLTAAAGRRRLARDTRTVDAATVRLKPTRAASRWLTARLARGSGRRVRVRVTASNGRDSYEQRLPRRTASITLTAPALPTPPKPPTPEQRAERRAAREVRQRVAERYEIGLDRAYADCRRRAHGRYRCDWSTGQIHQPWGETCVYGGEADADRYGSYWSVRLYDISSTCY
jgi:hypothetical protein